MLDRRAMVRLQPEPQRTRLLTTSEDVLKIVSIRIVYMYSNQYCDFLPST